MTTATGTASFLDLDGDGAYETLRVSGTNNGQPVPQTDLGLVFLDKNGDGKADYVSIPWALAGILGVRSGDGQVWLPLTGDSAGRPNSVTVLATDPANPGTTGGISFVLPIVPAAQGGPDRTAIPTLSSFALLALALAIGSAGALLSRGRIFS